MAASGQIQASLFQATQQTTLALANFNLDFTLYKAAAPPQYVGLGSALSKRRRKAAEDGYEHIVARKLGALFHKNLPPTPTLLARYGERASAIAASETASAKGSRADGIFAEYLGADATNIWAAATSGPEAIAVHLLACMLARIWQAPKATAIWAEIIDERLAELGRLDPSDPLHLSEIAAARLELSRDDLANWDASARAWLSIADGIMKKEQTQFLLLVDKTRLSVDLSAGVYKSVVQAWHNALTTIDSILNGMAHSVQDGAILLGLSSWHLFPDIHVLLKGSSKHIMQHDQAARNAGILTFGLEGRSPDEDDGVRWSLPLAHLRHYGDPVISKSAMGTHSLPLTMDEFRQVLLGSAISHWGHYGHDIVTAAELIRAMWEFLCRAAQESTTPPETRQDIIGLQKTDNWLRILATAADEFLSSEGFLRQTYERLLECGVRRYGNFLAPQAESPGPVFGMWEIARFIPLLNDEGVISFLRQLVGGVKVHATDLLIRYRGFTESDPQPQELQKPTKDEVLGPGREDAFDMFSSPLRSDSWPEESEAHAPANSDDLDNANASDVSILQMADAEPMPDRSTLAVDFVPASDAVHGRVKSPSGTKRKSSLTDLAGPSASKKIKEDFNPNDINIPPGLNERAYHALFQQHHAVSPRQELIEDPENVLRVDYGYEYATAVPFEREETGQSWHVRWLRATKRYTERAIELETLEEQCGIMPLKYVTNTSPNGFIIDIPPGSTLNHYDTSEYYAPYVYLCGHREVGSIFRKQRVELSAKDTLELSAIRSAFDGEMVDPAKFLSHLRGLKSENPETTEEGQEFSFIKSLRAISTVATVYRTMPNATVTMKVFLQPLNSALWIPPNRGTIAPKSQEQEHYFRRTRSRSVKSDDMGTLRPETPVIPKQDIDTMRAYTLDRAGTFACIAMFDHGSLNVDPSGLTEVMALSTGNSIYVAMPLLCDPYDIPLDFEVRRVIGNIGQAGVSFLCPPPTPKVKKVTEEDAWLLVNHAAFDGRLEDSFSSTSLHLAFTKLKIPVGYTIRGGQEIEACFRETLVSIHSSDKKGWVADLDILGALNNPLFHRLKGTAPCKHSAERRNVPGFVLKSIDNWEEFLDRPKLPGIVRAHNNWLARLAAAALNVQQGFPTFVFDNGSSICWACAVHQYQKSPGYNYQQSHSYQHHTLPYFIC
jgi:hypothetical protein